jgi:mitochondrial import inner membrane translocase subunit TIM16
MPSTSAIAGDAAGVANATSGSATDKLTREHRMTLDEASLILILNRGDPLEAATKLPPPFPSLPLSLSPFRSPHMTSPLRTTSTSSKSTRPRPRPQKAQVPPPAPAHSYYLQPKVVRALERLQAEARFAGAEAAEAEGAAAAAEGAAKAKAEGSAASTFTQGPSPPGSSA